MTQTLGWAAQLRETIPSWLARLNLDGRVGRYLPALGGRTVIGDKASLGFSCFALKLFDIYGLWWNLPDSTRQQWTSFLLAFQRPGGEFVDPPVLDSHQPLLRTLKSIARRRYVSQAGRQRNIVVAETKQALATLSMAGKDDAAPFRAFPSTPESLRTYLTQSLDWNAPWAAGGQAAGMGFFVAHEAPKFMRPADVRELREEFRLFLPSILDPATGAWYAGSLLRRENWLTAP
jgi:hypothetical protein